MDTKALIEERVKLHEENKALLDKVEKREAGTQTLTPEEQQEFDKRDARITEIRETLDRIEKQNAEERSLAESRGRRTETAVVEITNTREQDNALAFRAWACGEYATPEMEAAAQRVGLRHMRRELETRALSVGTTTAGGNAVINEMMKSYWETEKWFGSVRKLATVWRTSTGAPLPIPNADDTANVGEIVAEAGALTTTADPTFNTLTLGAFKYSSKAVIVSVELLQDSVIPLPEYLGRRLGERIARIQNTHFSVGAGTTLPFGVATQAAVGATSATTNNITFDDIITLYHSVDVAYRNDPDAGFMMNDATAALLRKVKDSQNRYLWEMSLQAGRPDMIFGRPVYINNDLDTAVSTAKRPVLYGSYKHYTIRDTSDVIFIRADELSVLNHQVVFLAFQRSDGNLPNVNSIKYLRTA
jgi:HK97 family phage major capsid protein